MTNINNDEIQETVRSVIIEKIQEFEHKIAVLRASLNGHSQAPISPEAPKEIRFETGIHEKQHSNAVPKIPFSQEVQAIFYKNGIVMSAIQVVAVIFEKYGLPGNYDKRKVAKKRQGIYAELAAAVDKRRLKGNKDGYSLDRGWPIKTAKRPEKSDSIKEHIAPTLNRSPGRSQKGYVPQTAELREVIREMFVTPKTEISAVEIKNRLVKLYKLTARSYQPQRRALNVSAYGLLRNLNKSGRLRGSSSAYKLGATKWD